MVNGFSSCSTLSLHWWILSLSGLVKRGRSVLIPVRLLMLTLAAEEERDPLQRESLPTLAQLTLPLGYLTAAEGIFHTFVKFSSKVRQLQSDLWTYEWLAWPSFTLFALDSSAVSPNK